MGNMRISGLASGMDIDSIVKQLMTAERMPLDKLEQKKQKLEWQRDDYREINTMLLNYNNFLFDDLIMSKTYNQKTVNISDPNEISVRNLNSTSDFSGTIKVNQLAKAASIVGGKIAGFDNTTTSKKSSQTLNELFGVSADQTIGIQAIKSDGTMGAVQPLTFKSTDTLDSVISRINNETDVTAFFDSQSGQMVLTAKNTGSIDDSTTTQNEIVLTGSLFDSLVLSTPALEVPGVNAKVNYNGLEMTRSSNTFELNGFEVTLKSASQKDINFSSTADVDKILEKVVKFVDDYNKIIEKVNGKLVEKSYRDYQPLTAEQKDAMKDKDIELWEEKARSGLLRNDSVLSSAMNRMRTVLYTPVNGLSSDSDSLADFGITTSSNWRDKGKLTIDEDKLRAAISKNPDGLFQLFAKDGATTEEKGFARRLRDILQGDKDHPDAGIMDQIKEKAGESTSVNNTFSIGRLLNNVGDQINSFQDRLQEIEDRYYRQFTAMEKAIQKANSQSTYMMQQFSAG
ncbi:flagellar hook-associated protein 2 [Schinkia sp. CFF1]